MREVQPPFKPAIKYLHGANGFKVMDPFHWTTNKSIYQRWQLWSEKARLALDAMEGDSEKTKISYFHHWINGEGMGHIEFRGEKYLNTFIVTNANDCPNLLSLGATFRMGVLLPNYPEENVVKGENVPNFKINTGTSSNVFQILQDL